MTDVWWDALEAAYQKYRADADGEPTIFGFMYYLEVQGYFDHTVDDDGVISDHEHTL